MRLMTPNEFYSHCPNLAVIKGYATKLLDFVERKGKELEVTAKKSQTKKTK